MLRLIRNRAAFAVRQSPVPKCLLSTASNADDPERAPPTPSSTPQTPPISCDRKMSAWQVHAYGDAVDELQFSDRVKIPAITDANDVLVRVRAASLNAIDLEMAKGFGSAAFNILRRCDSQHIEFPLTLGRDFVGTVEHKGMAVRESLQIGDRVWGTVPFHRSGSHAEFTVLDANFVSAAPSDCIDDCSSAAALYAGLTAWSGLFVSGGLGGLAGATTSLGGGRGKSVCVLGASGGVGHLAVQMCRAEGVRLVATCADDARGWLTECAGPQAHIIDYRAADAERQLVEAGPYDVVLDCAGLGGDYASRVPGWRFGQFVTFTSPVLGNIDAYGLLGAGVQSLLDLIAVNWRSVRRNASDQGTEGAGLVKWAYVAPCPHAIEYLKRLLDNGQLRPHIEQTFEFAHAQDAYRRMADGHVRGKIVLQLPPA